MTHPFNLLWVQPSWFEQASHWIEQELEQYGIERIGAIFQPHIRHLDEYQQLQNSVDIIASFCEKLSVFRVPKTLHYGDLHDGNDFIGDGYYRFFDWGDSSISHPFFSLHSICDSLKKLIKVSFDVFSSNLKEALVESLSRRFPAFKNALEFRIEYQEYLRAQ